MQIGILFLFKGKSDVAANGLSPRFERTPVGRFHDARSAARDRDQSKLGDPFSKLPGFFIIHMPFRKASGSKYRYRRAHKVK